MVHRTSQPTQSLVASKPATAECGTTSRALCGWSPPPLPADTPLKRWIDRLMPRTGAPVILYFGAVAALLIVAGHLPERAQLATDGLASLAGGGWCAANFWRCRHAHCLVNAAGWIGLSLFVFAEAVFGRSLIWGDEQLALIAVLAAALAFEAAWTGLRRTNAL